jgi:hypothetical protein
MASDRSVRIGFAFLLASLITIVTYISIKPRREQQVQQQQVKWPWVCIRVFLAAFLGAIFLSLLINTGSEPPAQPAAAPPRVKGGSGGGTSKDSLALELALSNIDTADPPF